MNKQISEESRRKQIEGMVHLQFCIEVYQYQVNNEFHPSIQIDYINIFSREFYTENNIYQGFTGKMCNHFDQICYILYESTFCIDHT